MGLRRPIEALVSTSGPFRADKGPIWLTEAVFLRRRALRWPNKALCFIGLKGLSFDLRGPFSVQEVPALA